jgi:hypothetical protein
VQVSLEILRLYAASLRRYVSVAAVRGDAAGVRSDVAGVRVDVAGVRQLSRFDHLSSFALISQTSFPTPPITLFHFSTLSLIQAKAAVGIG